MLELELGGKTVTTTAEKQLIKINGNPVEVERVGNSIYVNRRPINLIIIDEKNRWKSVLFLAILIPMIVGIFYLAATNQDLIIEGGDAVMDFVQTSVKPAIESTVDTVGGFINGNEPATSTNPSGK